MWSLHGRWKVLYSGSIQFQKWSRRKHRWSQNLLRTFPLKLKRLGLSLYFHWSPWILNNSLAVHFRWRLPHPPQNIAPRRQILRVRMEHGAIRQDDRHQSDRFHKCSPPHRCAPKTDSKTGNSGKLPNYSHFCEPFHYSNRVLSSYYESLCMVSNSYSHLGPLLGRHCLRHDGESETLWHSNRP